ncbi:t-SNARE [Neoconidiobolus thromboides FSU 785]|nr:t-SNARE [Neoconidiobolus thromboides FSU 785]
MNFDDVEVDKMQEVSLEEKKPLMTSLDNCSTAYDNSAGSGASPLDGFFQRVEKIQQEITYFINLTEQLRTLRSSELEQGVLNQKSNLLSNNLKEQMMSIKEHIRDLIQYCNKSYVEHGDHQIRKIQVDALKKRFLKGIEDQQKLETQFQKDMKERIVRQFAITNPDANPDEIEAAVTNNDTTFFSSAVLNSTRKDSGKNALEEVKERHQDILMIDKSITELRQIYESMATMIELQDPILDNVEKNVGSTNEHLESAQVELGHATDHAKASRKKKFFLMFLGLAVLTFLIIGITVFIYFQATKKQG